MFDYIQKSSFTQFDVKYAQLLLPSVFENKCSIHTKLFKRVKYTLK